MPSQARRFRECRRMRYCKMRVFRLEAITYLLFSFSSRLFAGSAFEFSLRHVSGSDECRAAAIIDFNIIDTSFDDTMHAISLDAPL